MAQGPGILFTAFERSGDEHAAPVIARLRALRPELPIWALGGERMEKAGARLIEPTTHKAVMLAGAAAQYFAHRKRLARLQTFLAEQPIAALVPVDSPAANWSVCALVRKTHAPGAKARIIHLVAPQLWAWAPWRIGKLRRLTDRVLCLLPFEEKWFESRGVPATFVGHPVFDAAPDIAPDSFLVGRASRPPSALLTDPPAGNPKIALLPGSRMGEIDANWPTMLAVYRRLRAAHGGMTALVAATEERIAQRVRELTGAGEGQAGWPAGLGIRVDQTDGVLDWCDLALVVSGTATLHVAVRRKPMVVLYNINWWSWNLVGRWIVQARTFSLPNLLYQNVPGPEDRVQGPESIVQSQGRGEGAEDPHPRKGEGGRPVPEFVPHFGRVEPVYEAMEKLVSDEASRERQRQALEAIAAQFAGRDYAASAAAEILRQVDGRG